MGICQTDTADCLLAKYVQSRTPDDGWKDRPIHVQFRSKVNKIDTLGHLVGFTIGIVSVYILIALSTIIRLIHV